MWTRKDLLAYIVFARNSNPGCCSNRPSVHPLSPMEAEDALGLVVTGKPAFCLFSWRFPWKIWPTCTSDSVRKVRASRFLGIFGLLCNLLWYRRPTTSSISNRPDRHQTRVGKNVEGLTTPVGLMTWNNDVNWGNWSEEATYNFAYGRRFPIGHFGVSMFTTECKYNL